MSDRPPGFDRDEYRLNSRATPNFPQQPTLTTRDGKAGTIDGQRVHKSGDCWYGDDRIKICVEPR